MDELAIDLMLLAARANGTLGIPPRLRFGLSGSELIRLAAARRVDIVRGRVVVLDTAATGDPLLDEALASMTGRWRSPTAKSWVARDRRGLVQRYLALLAEAGIIRADRRRLLGLFPATRWTLVDTARAARARARLQAVADGTGGVDAAQAALAGLASAIGVTGYLFPGLSGARARKRLKEAARRDPAAGPATGAATAAATDAATSAATTAAMDAAVRAATDAAVAASISAATAAATTAAVDAGHHAGGAAGGHHG
jgi:hypothetical protein